MNPTLRNLTTEERQRRLLALSAEVTRILSDRRALPDVARQILQAIQRETGIEAAGIRLRQGVDFPYTAAEGFSPGFLKVENSVVARTAQGEFCLNEEGEVCLECTCGLVLSGKTDPANPQFTPGGSSWIDEAGPALNRPAVCDPRLHPRNRCLHEGFESVALVPIRVDSEIIGLLQLNDRHQGCFDLELVQYFEGLALSLGLALQRMREEQAVRENRNALQESEARFSTAFHKSPAPQAITRVEDGEILDVNEAYCRLFGYLPKPYEATALAEVVRRCLDKGT